MAETFDELLDLSELESSSEIAKFIDKDCGINNYVNTWEYVSYSYSRAFEALARKAFEEGARGGNLGNPLLFLARHSIELELKSAIVEYSETEETTPELAGHADIQEADPRGDRFRYPLDIKGQSFEPSRVEIEGLIRAHNSVTTYLDACAEMHSEGYRG
jgi:hypothetical protein